MIFWSTLRRRLLSRFPERGETVYSVIRALYHNKQWDSLRKASGQLLASTKSHQPFGGLLVTEIYLVGQQPMDHRIDMSLRASKVLKSIRHSTTHRRRVTKPDLTDLEALLRKGMLGSIASAYRDKLSGQLNDSRANITAEVRSLLLDTIEELMITHAWLTLIHEEDERVACIIRYFLSGTPVLYLDLPVIGEPRAEVIALNPDS